MRSFFLTLVLILAGCQSGGNGGSAASCKALTGSYDFYDSPMEIQQDGCGPTVSIEEKYLTTTGQTVSQKFVLDGVRKLEEGGTEQNFRYYTRTWSNDTWIDKWERYENGQLQGTTISHFYLDSQSNLVFEDLNDPNNRKVFKRLK